MLIILARLGLIFSYFSEFRNSTDIYVYFFMHFLSNVIMINSLTYSLWHGFFIYL